MKDIFDEIYDKYHKDLYQFIFYMIKDPQQTEDLVQEVYIKVLKSYHSFEGNSNVKTWLFSIAKHVTFDYFRKKKSTSRRILPFFDWGEKGELLPDNTALPEEITIQSDEIREIYKHLDQCTVDQRSVLILRFIQSFSIQETSDILNFSTSKVKTVQHRGLNALRKSLKSYHKGDEG
jgi:RNA polymerase sigma-70 factor, ECF subfamily